MKTTNKWLGLVITLVLVASIVMIFTLNVSAASTVAYLDEAGEMQVRSNVTELTGSLSNQTLNAGWYVFSGTVSANTLTLNGDVHLILGDGASVTAYKIVVPYGSNLTIYAQMEKTGTLKVDPGTRGTAIGGSYDNPELGMGNITINGGIINATGEHDGVAIGVGANAPSDMIGNIVINDGTVSAINSTYFNAIGFDSDAPNSTITINGGTITAKTGNYSSSNRSYAIGIGSGYQFGGVFIHGGTIDVYGEALAIGGEKTPITITGGKITASTRLGPVIGAETNTGKITITGGHITATSKSDEAAIGGGLSYTPATITISGGTIIAKGGQYAIGGSDYYGGNKNFDLILTGGNLILTSSGKSALPSFAIIKNANGETISTSAQTLTLTDAPNGTEILSIGDIAYGIAGAQTNESKVCFYFLSGTPLPPVIKTSNGLYLPDNEGGTTYSLHTSHTVAPNYSAHSDDHEKHEAFYTCCDALEVEAHSYDTNTHVCPCGAFVVADVNGTKFASFDNAIRYAQTLSNATVTLYASASLSDDINVSGDITLDLNGHELVTSDKYMYALYLRSGSLMLKDSSRDTTGRIVANSAGIDTIGVENGSLIVKNGVYGRIAVENGTAVTVYDASIRDLSVREGTLSIHGGSFGKITAPATLQTSLGENLFFYDMDDTIVDASALMSLENVTTKLGADLSYSVATLAYTETNYTALEKCPALTLSIFGTEIASAHYQVAYTDNLLPGTAAVAVRGLGDYTGENTFSFTIHKGELLVVENPESTHPFGDTYADKAITDGKVVIVGNEQTVISGVWTYVENEPKATFTPDAQYEGLFETLTEAYDVNITLTAYEPVFTISAPVTVLIPGVETVISVDIRNFFDEEITDLPTEFIIYYTIGDNPVERTAVGLTFTLDSSARMGDKITLRVESLAVAEKYAPANSLNTLVFTVGQADYTAEFEDTRNSIEKLESALDELSKVLSEKASGEATLSELASLQDKINALNALVDELMVNEQSDEVNALKETIDTLQNEVNSNKSAIETKNDGTAIVAIVIASLAILANLAICGYVFLIKPKKN